MLVLVPSIGLLYSKHMHTPSEHPFGDEYYERQKALWGHSVGYWGEKNTEAQFREAHEAALSDPTFDFFEHYMPTGRSKHDIGRYALANGVTVPLIRSLQDLRDAAEEGNILIRSDGTDEYSGPSGLRGTHMLGRVDASNRHLGGARMASEEDELVLGVFNGVVGSIESGTSQQALQDLNRLATAQVLSGVMYPGMQLGLSPQSSSLWHRIEGDNLSMMRDPVQQDLYHFRWGEHISTKVRANMYEEGYPRFDHNGGTVSIYNQRKLDAGYGLMDNAHFIFIPRNSYAYPDYPKTVPDGGWEVEEGMYIPDPSGIPKEWLPIQDAIAMYERVRTLPYFDQRQIPVMEMQYSRSQKKLHFLQYLKTNRILESLDAFPLPDGDSVVRGNDVVGATKPEGERMRIHIGVTGRNAREAQPIIKDQGVLLPFEMIIAGGGNLQSLALNALAAFIDYRLTFFNHHFGSAMFTRTPLSVGLSDSSYQIGQRLNQAHHEFIADNPENSLGYINAIVTSNGREVTVESDWEPHVVDER